MRARDLPMRLLRTAMMIAASVCLGATTPVAAQQASDSARVSARPATPASAPSATLPGPRVSPSQFQVSRPSLARSDAASSSMAGGSGGGHTIVISTLTLVLIVIIVVLLVR
jgi:hypothetical protein